MMFHLFRHLLVLAVVTYVVVRLIDGVWQWQSSLASAPRGHRTIHRYITVSFLRLRCAKFAWDIAQVVALSLILAWLVSVQL